MAHCYHVLHYNNKAAIWKKFNVYCCVMCDVMLIMLCETMGHLSQQTWGTVEPRSIVPATIVFPHVLFAIFGPELSSI